MPPQVANIPRAAPRVDRLPVDIDLRAVLTARKCTIDRNPRNGITRNFELNVSERFGVLRAKIIGFLEETLFRGLVLSDENIYFRASKGAPQDCYEIMTAENFVALLTQRLKRVPSNDKRAWNQDIYGTLRFEFCVYCRSRDARPTIHRATAARIRDATVAVQRFQEENNVSLGPIAMNHVVTTHARQPDNTPVTLPDDNTTRQAMTLVAALTASTSEAISTEQSNIATIRLEVNGNWTNFNVDVTSLRAALRLPAHDIFTQGIYHGFIPVDPPAEDMEDTDQLTNQVV